MVRFQQRPEPQEVSPEEVKAKRLTQACWRAASAEGCQLPKGTCVFSHDAKVLADYRERQNKGVATPTTRTIALMAPPQLDPGSSGMSRSQQLYAMAQQQEQMELDEMDAAAAAASSSEGYNRG